MILVFGRGQLGEELAARASAAAIPLAALSRAETDIADLRAVTAAIDRIHPSLVVNTAAFTGVDLAESQPAEAARVNETAAGIVADQCARAGIPLVHISTDYVFDGKKDGPYRESDVASPVTVYGRTKLAGEAAVRAHARDHLILRTAWLYGRHGRNFLTTIARRARTAERVRVVGDQTGCPTSTEDLADAILRLAPALERGDARFGTYHFAGEGETTWYGFACRIVAAEAHFTRRAPVVEKITSAEYPAEARRPANSALDCGLFTATFGFRAGPWEEATDRIVAGLFSVEKAA